MFYFICSGLLRKQNLLVFFHEGNVYCGTGRSGHRSGMFAGGNGHTQRHLLSFAQRI